MVDPSLNVLDPSSSNSGGGALLLHTDANIIGTGRFIPQISSTPAAIAGNQGLNLENSIAASTPNELDLVGVVTSDGSGNLIRSEEHTSELQSLTNLVCRLLLEKK